MSPRIQPYAAVHEHPQGEGDSRPTALQIIEDEGLINKMTDKVMLVTGSSSGIGIETVRALHATGAHIFMQARDMKRGQEVLDEIASSSKGTGKLELLEMNLDSFKSVRVGAEEFLKKSKKLNVLVNNAGIRNPPEGRTVDGFEIQFGTNHLGHFLLFQLLKPTLLASSTLEFNSRVINVSSGSHRRGPIHFDNLNLDGIYTPRLGYAQSKTANILMANEIERLYGSQGLHGFSISPGLIKSRAQRHDDPKDLAAILPTIKDLLKDPAQGAATTVWGAVAKVLEGKGAMYLEDCAEAVDAPDQDMMRGGYAPFAFDEEAEKKLWKVSCEMVGVEE
ncbi:short-chain dehydrogenase [Mollisia scopiformis]|uniref:Short-chain dehydrogenase n=1 Tax=Mollisia scopiformis TaxID=149040 RepID=A0A194XNY9_MOLSC|nr:short-chain dehydrogenase [Mollisia scopiformis]KUJ21903.1 short-chain dehydrogenase [Mollisia scopiformis]